MLLTLNRFLDLVILLASREKGSKMPQNHFACQRMAEIRRFSFLCKILNSTGRLCLIYGYIFVGKYDIQLLSAFESNLKSKVEGIFKKLWLASWSGSLFT